MRHSHTVQRRRTIQRSLRRLKHRIKRLATSYVSPLGWAVAALAVASLVAFVLLGWHELLAMAVVFAVMLAAAVMLSLGNTSFQATIDVSSRHVTVSEHGESRRLRGQSGPHPHHVGARRPAHRRQPRTVRHSHARRRPVTPDDCGIHRRQPRGAAHRPAIHPQRRPVRSDPPRKETRGPDQRVHPPADRAAQRP